MRCSDKERPLRGGQKKTKSLRLRVKHIKSRVMKKGNFFANCVFAVSVILTVLSFSACTDDSNDVVATTSEVIEQAEVPFSVVLKAMNSDGNDITTKGEVNGATLFVFDQNNDFFEQINVNKSTILSRRAIDINCPNSNDITVIAWSGINSGNEEISNMSKANIISDLQVSLKENNGIANIPSDLFYGQVTLHKNSSTKSTVSNELQIIRKTSIFQLSTKGLIKYLGSNAGNFEYRIKNTKSSLDYNGNPTGEEVEFAFPASFDEKGNLTTETQAIFPAQNITVELYKDGNLIFSSEKDKNGELFAATPGKRTEITFKYSGEVSANITIADWATVIQHITMN